jgi:hypothetical protein
MHVFEWSNYINIFNIATPTIMPYVDNSPIDVVMYVQQVTQKNIHKPYNQLYNHVQQNQK